MGTLTTNVAVLPEHCSHKLPTSCRLTSTPLCCACYDRRPHASTYRVYIDGVGFVPRGTRWQSYCWFCKVFWDNRVANTWPRMETRQTRIPDVPDQSRFVREWFQWHRGYKTITSQLGQEERVPLARETLKDCDPGILPQGQNEYSVDLREQYEEAGGHVSSVTVVNSSESLLIEDTLDQLLEEAMEEDIPGSSTGNAVRTSNTSTAVPNDAEHASVQLPTATQIPNSPLSTNDTTENLSRVQAALERARAQHGQLTDQRQRISAQLARVEEDISMRRESLRRLERNLQRDRNFARVFGTREEIEQQGESYVSPIGGLFQRAWGRYSQAEQDRHDSSSAARLGADLDRLNIPSGADVVTVLDSGGQAMHTSTVEMSNESTDQTRYMESATSETVGRRQTIHEHQDQREPGLVRRSGMLGGTPGLSIEAPPLSHDFIQEAVVTHTTMTEELSRWQQLPGHARNLAARLDRITREIDEDLVELGAAGVAYPSPNFISPIAGNDELAARLETIMHEIRQDLGGLGSNGGLDAPNTTRPPPREEAELTVNLACQICYSQMADTAVLPCGHLAMCGWCADQAIPTQTPHTRGTIHVRGLGVRCPCCRATVKQRVKIYPFTRENPVLDS